MSEDEIDAAAGALALLKGSTAGEWRAVLLAGMGLGYPLETVLTLAKLRGSTPASVGRTLAVAKNPAARRPAVTWDRTKVRFIRDGGRR